MKEPNNQVKLIVKDGDLYTPKESITEDWLKQQFSLDHPILIVQHLPNPKTGALGGDYDTIRWPKPDAENLRQALFDAREQGLIPDVPSVLLPDGTEFRI